MKIEVKKIIHARSLSEETNAFTAQLHIDGKYVADCKNSGRGGMTDVHPKYSENKKLMDFNRSEVKKAELFCKTLPKFKGKMEMSLDFYVDLEIEKDLHNKEVKRVINNLNKKCLNSIIILSKKKLENFKEGIIIELPYRTFGWKGKPIDKIPAETLKQQLPAIKLLGDEFIYNQNLPK